LESISLFKRISSIFWRKSNTDNTYTVFSEILKIIRHGGMTNSLYWEMPWSRNSGMMRPLLVVAADQLEKGLKILDEAMAEKVE